MSNRPKIYGMCPAGCLFETIHRDEFNAAATYKNLVLENGAVNVEMLHKYKIVPATDEDSGEYALSITAVLSNGEEHDISPEDGFNYDPYHTYIFFECLDLQPSYLGYYNLIFEVDGQRHTTEIDSPDHSVDATIDHIVITGAAQVSIYSDGEIKAEDGESVSVAAVAESNVDGGENVVTFTDGKTLTVKNGKTGAAGKDGVSPTVAVSKEGKVTTITITDKGGTKTVTINDGEGGGVSSWNDLTDKPFDKETKGVNIAVLPQTSVDFDTGAYLVHGFAENSFIEGNKYIVVWNGKEYEAYCYVEDGTYIIGNGVLADMTTKTDHPFCVVSFGGSACYVYKDTDTAETVTIKINGVQETIYHQLDPKYIPNMYYTEERNDVEILPTSTAVSIDNPMMGELYIHGDPITLVAGKTYTVTYNGVEYECVATALDFNGVPSIALGDVGMLATGASGDYPFLLGTNDEIVAMGLSAMILALDGASSITVSILGGVEIIHHIPPKFIKDMYGEEETFILPETEVSYGVIEELGMNGSFIPIAEKLIVGQRYDVVYNGVKYSLTLNGIGSEMAMGNMAVAGGEDSGEPFCIYGTDEISVLIPIGTETNATISISAIVINKIKNKYIDLPKAIPFFDLMECGLNPVVIDGIASGVELESGKAREIETAILNGAALFKVDKNNLGSHVYFLVTSYELTGLDEYLIAYGHDMTGVLSIFRINMKLGSNYINVSAEATGSRIGILNYNRTELYLCSANNTEFKITVDDDGNLTATKRY